MSLSHSVQTENKHVDFFSPITQFLDNIGDITKKYNSFELAEKAIREIVGQLEISMVQEALEQYDINVPVIEHDGKTYRQVLRQEKSYVCAAGKIKVKRSLYRVKGQLQSICPLELQAGIVENIWTPSAARLGFYVTAQLSPYQGEKLFKEFGYLTPSKSSLNRLSTRLGERWDDKDNRFEQTLCEEITIPENAVTVSASFDGIMLPLNKKTENGYQLSELADDHSEQDKQEYQEKKAKAFYREASCAAINFYDEDGERLETLRFGRMPEAHKTMLKNQLSQSIKAIIKAQPDINIVKIADGAKDNWRYLSNVLLPGQGTEILDYYHASEHLSDAFDAGYGKGTAEAVAQYKKYRSVLKNDGKGIDKVINTLRYLHKKHPKNKTLQIELNYFRNNRHRMKYAEAIETNLPIGSGVTEASCKTLVTQRMKCAGMRWDIQGGQGVLTARSLIQSDRFDRGWELLSAKFVEKIVLQKNVVQFRAN